mmetsp:Transcript_45036/g.104321  ORF Transcript_45036/g.104321 Transcript_45036/m.104321 type:complete len:214 (-) Transcript_45036:1223-1864(-)
MHLSPMPALPGTSCRPSFQPLVFCCPPVWQSPSIDALGCFLPQVWLPQDIFQQPSQFRLEGLSRVVEGRVCTCNILPDNVRFQEVLWMAQNSSLAEVLLVIAVQPIRDRHPLLINVAIRFCRIDKGVNQLAPDEDLQQMPRLSALARLAAKLRYVQTMCLCQFYHTVANSLDLPFGNIARLQQLVQNLSKREVFAAVPFREYHRWGRFWSLRN